MAFSGFAGDDRWARVCDGRAHIEVEPRPFGLPAALRIDISAVGFTLISIVANNSAGQRSRLWRRFVFGLNGRAGLLRYDHQRLDDLPAKSSPSPGQCLITPAKRSRRHVKNPENVQKRKPRDFAPPTAFFFQSPNR